MASFKQQDVVFLYRGASIGEECCPRMNFGFNFANRKKYGTLECLLVYFDKPVETPTLPTTDFDYLHDIALNGRSR